MGKYEATFFHIEKCAGSSIKGALEPYKQILYFVPIDQTNRGRADSLQGPHFSPQHFIDKYGWKEWGQLGYTFTCIRNPWERLVSLYLYIKRTRYHAWCRDRDWTQLHIEARQLDFKDFIQKFPPPSIKERLFVDAYMPINYIMRYENLNIHISFLHYKFGIKINLPYEKVAPKYDWKSYYSPNLIQWVNSYYEWDCTQLGYTFE